MRELTSTCARSSGVASFKSRQSGGKNDRTSRFHQRSLDGGNHGNDLGNPRWARSCPASAEFGRNRAAQAQGAGQCRRLSHAHLRPGTLSHAAQPADGPDERHRGGLPAAAKADRDNARRHCAAPQLCDRQPGDPLRDITTRAERARRRRRHPGDCGRRAQGISRRWIRFSLADPSSRAVTPGMVEPLSNRVADLGWHVQFNVDGEMIDEMASVLRRLPSAMVFDHLAHPPLPAGIEHSSHKIVRELIDKGRSWVKVSGAYSNSKIGPPSYPEATKIAQAFVKAAPERLVWGSDWPHPGLPDNNKPNDALLF